MAQLFPPSANTVARVGFIAAGVGILLLLGAADLVSRSAWVTREAEAREQPVPFSHKHHAGGLAIDCRYCHTSVEASGFAGIPEIHTCMGCHSQLFTEAEILAPIRASYRTDGALAWVRVHDLPDFVYFDHSIHVAKGVGCTTCHGPVDTMPLTWQTESLQMEWCLACHREPERFLRPVDQVFSVAWQQPDDQEERGTRLVGEYRIQKAQLTNCSVCHR